MAGDLDLVRAGAVRHGRAVRLHAGTAADGGRFHEHAWWAPLGGIVGAVAVFAGFLLIQKLGAGPVNGVTITANILASLAIDHFGLLRMEQHAMNPLRALGAAPMVGGVILIAKF